MKALSYFRNPIKLLSIGLIAIFLWSCGGGGGGGGDTAETTSPLVSNSTLRLQNDLATISGISTNQAQSIVTTASTQLKTDGLTSSSDASKVLPSLLGGAIEGIGATLTGETLINQAISQSIATIMTLVGESELSASLSPARSTALNAAMQSLLETLVGTALTSLDKLGLNEQALQQSVGNVINAVVTNLGKAKVASSEVAKAVQSVAKSATSSLTKLSVTDTAKLSLKSQVESTMKTSIETLASNEPSLVTDVESVQQSATTGMEAGATETKDPTEMAEGVFGTSKFGFAKFSK